MERNHEMERMLIKFYNMVASTSFKHSNEQRQWDMGRMLEEADGDAQKVKDFIKEWVGENPTSARDTDGIADCRRAFSIKNRNESKPELAQTAPTEQAVSTSLDIIGQAVASIVAEPIQEKVEQKVLEGVEQKVRDFIKSEYGAIERKVTTVVDGKPKDMRGIVHEKFDTILKFVANNEPVFLTGPAGSGKNVICKQVAEALGLKFYFSNAVTQEYKITGFTDAMGNYQPTQFYKAFTEGGVFMLDEMDASIPEVLVILNAAIANRYFDFPAPIGYVEAHPDFRVVAAGNTTGNGADYNYVGRQQLDMASLDRFAVVAIDYSELIEMSVANGDNELVKFCREFRNAAKRAGVNVIVSYRAIGRMATMIQIMDVQEVLQTCLIKGLERDDVNMIKNELHDHSKYADAIAKIAA